MAKTKDENFDITFKVLILGEQGVGKTCLLSRFMLNVPYNRDKKSTVGVDIGDALLNVDGKNVKLLFWDTCGEEGYGNVMKKMYNNTHCVLFVYDVCNEQSLQRIDRILRECERHCGYKEFVRILVANKIDKNSKRCINYQTGVLYAVQHNMEYVEASAHDNIGISLIIEKVATKIMKIPVLCSNPWVNKRANINSPQHAKSCAKNPQSVKNKEVPDNSSTSPRHKKAIGNVSKNSNSKQNRALIHNAHQPRQKNSSTSSDVAGSFKISLLGEMTVGKTSIIRRMCNKGYVENLIATLRIENEIVNYELDDGRIFQICIWDTIGQERFDSVVSNVYKNSLAIIFVYDVNYLHTFERIDVLLQRCERRCLNEEFVRVLVANQIDSPSRVVTTRQGKDYAEAKNMDYIEVSARENIGTGLIIPKVIQRILATPSLYAANNPNQHRTDNAHGVRTVATTANTANLSSHTAAANTPNTGGSSCC